MKWIHLVVCVVLLSIVACADRSDPVLTNEPDWVSSTRGVFTVQLAPIDSSAPLVGQFSEWSINVRTAAGVPATGLRIDVAAGMPSHGHGMPSSPTVEAGSKNGSYIVKGVRLNMRGDWEFRLSLTGTATTDTAVIQKRIDY